MISGFTIVRNAELLDYPFIESIQSLQAFCDEIIISCGRGSDNTEGICLKLAESDPRIKVIFTDWTEENQQGGAQLRAKTDHALSQCQGDWCFYLQADEVLHESDIPQFKDAIARASQIDRVDGIVFDYLHFYGDYRYTIEGRNWYRREIRAFKNHRGIKSFRDAQGFRKENGDRLMAIPSGSRVFHYGYVRSQASLKTKSQEMSQWWGKQSSQNDRDFQWIRHIGLKPFRLTHPKFMATRIESYPHRFDPKLAPRKWDRSELKNLITLMWESIVPYRIGEFRNYDLLKTESP